ncbi:MAG: type I DNA topoisomerase, partial [Chloroflexales bacterium]|nr:type I DNA topoisomerase [Chloroflexales bacterium]
MAKLVIVESPAKAKTIQKYLGPGYRVTASMGHVRDLPKSDLSIDVANDFAPVYEVTKQKVVNELRSAIKGAEAVYLATDPDREGEAIAWHITQAVGIPRSKPVYRVEFQEITKNAVQQAIANPRQIDSNLVNAQQARRVLDRLVGYQISPLLWDKVKRGLSAGRVQSVAVRLLVEREREIEAFKAVEYWTIEADLSKRVAEAAKFRAVLIEIAGKKLDKFAVENQAQADGIVRDLDGADYAVQKVTRKDKRRGPAPPFTTSTLQQEAGRKLGFSAKRTMSVAQKLYEGVDIGGSEGTVGLITYMRTDSTSVGREAQAEAREVITARFGPEYVPEKPPFYKTKAKGAQEAHEAIRPTSSQRTPQVLQPILDRDMYRLYDLIWKRFIASQMAHAVFDSTTVDIAARSPRSARSDPAPYIFRATGSVPKFLGFLAVYNVSLDEGEEDEDSERRLPPLSEGEALNLLALLPLQHFTEPPPRYTEASLVKELERLGIGRPSTYAQVISTIQEREYAELTEKKLLPTTMGRLVTDLLVDHFPKIVDYNFTSDLEQQLDDIAEGTKQWVPVLRDFYGPFAITLATARDTMRNVKREDILTGLACPKCHEGELAVKFGRNGEFLACTRYSKDGSAGSCDFTSDFHRNGEGQIVLDAASAPETSDVMCNVCGKPMVIKKSRFGPFLGCSGYPECANTRRLGKDGKPAPLPVPTGVACPKCHEGELLQRRGKFGRPFFGCNRYPKCDYLTNDLATVGDYKPDPNETAGAAKQPERATASSSTAATSAKRAPRAAAKGRA